MLIADSCLYANLAHIVVPVFRVLGFVLKGLFVIIWKWSWEKDQFRSTLFRCSSALPHNEADIFPVSEEYEEGGR